MNQYTLLIASLVALVVGSVLGYYARQSIAKKQAGTLEAKLQKKVLKAKQDADLLLSQAQKEIDNRRFEVLKTERRLLNRANVLDQKLSSFEKNHSCN